jgi:hypothetical protein
MNVVIYMPKCQQGVELNKQGVKPRQRIGLGQGYKQGQEQGTFSRGKQGNNF